ncbi:PD-(D/E)XK nuclease-like domain-containing protein [Prauserella muralis]|uniref:Putative exodeoxyribonuclease 8 PDDEXK-like domain-containing protein n=1 Tax=Prauserella muralis TaxID=588067 RepID=A0A2V4AZP2_9PSEU|nr:PD-(D/E)XK nuclease-like domain-containing protein [Prauserella muralis]PXY27404.1 hypothetical protein BAY60_13295 [Prauserella muralis]TWE22900.1 PDDEXK-like uncharacterized protein DUF3799 [Prauserella muralis]
MTATAERVEITEPGVYDLPDAVYHADPVPGKSLSSTGARLLLPPSCPAKFKWRRDNPAPPKREFDLGHAAHKLVLGAGPGVAVIHDKLLASNGAASTKAAKEFIAEARAEGMAVLKEDEWAVVEEMAAKLREHPTASRLLSPERGRTEQSLFWTDRITGVACRARLDHLPHPTDRRMILTDYKTAASAAPSKIERAIADHGYNQQLDWYREGILALGLARDVACLLVVQEKEPPYVVTVVEPTVSSMQWGQVLNQHARRVYARCVETGHWPGYTDDIAYLPLPAYTERDLEQRREAGEFDILKEHIK